MLRSILIALILFSYSMLSHAMQPVSVEGTSVSSAYFNSNIDVISEEIDINISKHFREARFSVRYEIYNRGLGNQIPVVFNIYDDKRGEQIPRAHVDIDIKLDGKPVAVKQKPSHENEALFEEFFKQYHVKPSYDDLEIYDTKNDDYNILNYVSFIETDLEVGRHTIVASYDVMPSYRENGGLTYEYSYDYSFEPIKSKQSFTNTVMNVSFDGEIENISMEVFANGFQNLEDAPNIDISGKVITFKKILPETIYLRYQRPFAWIIEVIVRLPIFGFFILFCVLAARWHIIKIKESSDLNFYNALGYIIVAGLCIPFISNIIYALYEPLAYMVLGAQRIDNMFTYLLFLAYGVLFLMFAPFYSAFIYYKYYKNKDKTASE